MITVLSSLALGFVAGQIAYLDYLWRHRGVPALPPAPPAPDDPVLLSADLAELLTDDTIRDLAELARHHEDAHEDARPASILRACVRVQVLAQRGVR
jgi:hypothetical protein